LSPLAVRPRRTPLLLRVRAGDRGPDGTAGGRPAGRAARRHPALSLRPRGTRPEGRASTGARGAAPGRIRPGPRRRYGAGADGGDPARARGAAHDRGPGRPAGRPSGRGSAARRLARRRLSPRQRHGAGGGERARRRRAPRAPLHRAACPPPVCGVAYPELSPRFFSFNSPHGACPDCSGLGVQRRFDPARVVSHPDQPLPAALASAALRALPDLETTIRALAPRYGIRPATPFADLPPPVQQVVLEGSGEEELDFVEMRAGRRTTSRKPFEGILAQLERRQRETRSVWLREELEGLVADRRCSTCEGTRLRREARFVRLGGKSLVEVSALSV